jgi:hypothetical protein
MSGGENLYIKLSNLLIVESENDQYFVEALVARLNNVSIKIDSPVCLIDEYECLGGISKLGNKLKSLKSQVLKEGIDKVGIIFDADDVGIDARSQQIQEKINLVNRNVGKPAPKIYQTLFV